MRDLIAGANVDMLPRFLSAIVLCLTGTAVSVGQTPAPPASVQEVVVRVAEQREKYIATFQNLMAVETKSFEIFDDDGKVKKRRVVRSNFIIYRLASAEDLVAEYRNVVAVDGKPRDDQEQRTEAFFEKVTKSENSASELDRIEEESLRFDPDIKISGLTLFQAIAVAENIRPSIKFTVTEQNTAAHGQIIIEFEQATQSPFIRVNRGSAPDPKKTSISFEIEGRRNEPLNERIRGSLWVDAVTFQVIKEVRETTVRPADFPLPVVISRTTSEYRSSEFGILTPMNIKQELYRLDRKRKIAVLDVNAMFEYTAFAKPDVEVRSAEVK